MTNEPTNLLHGLRILVVEDTAIVADELAYQLHRLGCEVVGPVGQLAEALAAVNNRELDGALLDLNLHNESGLPVADELFKRRVPFVFMTGYDAMFLPLEYRVFACLQKPFTGDQLRKATEKEFAPQSPARVAGN